jgi:hypothetical protein
MLTDDRVRTAAAAGTAVVALVGHHAWEDVT